MFTEYDDYDGLGLAELVREGKVSPQELLDEAVARIEKLNAQLNALVTPLFEQARDSIAAGLPEGTFKGVPFALKELVVSIVGAPTTAASRLLARNMPSAEQ
jgi:amidase